MSDKLYVVAVDLGAESGRVILVGFDQDGIELNEIHRFPNQPVKIFDHLHWNALGLLNEIKHGLSVCAQSGKKISSLGVDTWGVDFGLLDSQGELIGNPYHYRDSRTDGMVDLAYDLVTKTEIFERTGIQFMQLNSLYQLLSMKGSPALDQAQKFLTMPDLFNYWLSGEIVAEFSNATTTQMYDQRKKDWSRDLLSKMGLPVDIYPEIVYPGTVIGNLLPSICDNTGFEPVTIIAPACHDTGSAVAAVPVQQDRFAYISSGTWSLVGVEIDEPVINAESLQLNFTNEGGVDGSVRLLKNVTGLWLVQECRRTWSNQGDVYSYGELAEMAENAKSFQSFVDPDAIDFLRPSDMPVAITEFCKRTDQKIPKTKAEILRTVFESLALKYRFVLESLEKLNRVPIEVIHVIGGGSQNELLNQLTADASGKKVITGPIEATALGNAIVQAVTLGYFEDIRTARKAISRQMDMKIFLPKQTQNWDDAYQQFKAILV